ncbi:uncharacterized protein KY384_000028 [Bacidia gigantensis]|uniref:uncharacterized protein n=1 Tax=Bacidia gigantensis TaxID=2732470 RepID=UPI001D046AD3|nr:uncharacterized protein KY384_000028 [Bacidia gigantensis]KAG8526435.1 hypothetical protein KY384_000028 [Bacidia gigantensis]
MATSVSSGQDFASDQANNLPHAVLVGFSGPSSAGKTTFSHLTSYVFAARIARILYGDDFRKELGLISTVNGYIDTDGIYGVDFKQVQGW